MKGKLIVIEGASDGIGKTTQYELLKEKLIKDGNTITSHHFPSYDTYQGKPVSEYLSGKFGDPNSLSPYFVNCLYATDRAVTWKLLLEKKYNSGDIILLDRYTTSSLIYQSALIEDIEEKKKFIDYVTDFEYSKIGIKKPDRVIFLCAPLEVVNKLRAKRKELQGEAISGDIHENNSSFMKKVYDSALFVADYLGWDIITCNDGDVMRDPASISDDIYNIIDNDK